MKFKGQKLFALLLCLAMLAAVFAGCGSDETPDEGSASTGSSDVIMLKWAHHNPPTSYSQTMGFDVIGKAIEESSGGRVDITFYPAQTLTKSSENYDAIIAGITDIGWSFFSYYPNRFPLSEVVNLPMIGFNSAAEASEAIWRLYEETDLIKDEWKETHILSFNSTDPSGFSTNFPVKTMEDLKGRKFRTASGPVLEFFQSLGVSIVSMPIPDCYQALEKGVIEGLALAWEGQENISAQEVIKYGYDVKTAAGGFYLAMNQQVWDSLPEDIKQVFNEECGLKAALQMAKAWDETNPATLEKFKNAGVKIETIANEELARWREKADIVNKAWAENLDAKGLKGTETLNKMKEIIKDIQSRES